MPSVRQKAPTRIAAATAFALTGICMHPAVPLAQQPCRGGSALVEETTRLAGRVFVPTTGGATAGANLPLDVQITDWHFVKATGSSTLPVQGFYVAHLLAGVIVADIDGSCEPHQPGDFWTVPQGAGLIVRITPPHEEALLETTTVSPVIP
jgi:hypothetical protein